MSTLEILTRKQFIWAQAHILIKVLTDGDAGELFEIVADGERKFIKATRAAQAAHPVEADWRFTDAELGEVFDHLKHWVNEAGKRGREARKTKRWRLF